MTYPSIAIIGSGFSGMTTAIQLKKKLNLSADIFESTEDIGGTWHYNQYPQAASDVPSHLYSFSFELNPNWSQEYSGQKEIFEYMRSVARKHHIYEQTQFNTEVIRASWIEQSKKWEIELKTNESKETQTRLYDFIFSGVGAIRVPNIPREFQSFQGKIIHSSYWDNDYDFTGKTVAIVGSGTSSVQIVPHLAGKASHLHNFLRTPTWITPRNNYYYPSFIKRLFSFFPFLMRIYRAYQFFMRELRFGVWGNANSWIAKFFRKRLEKQMTQLLVSKGRPDLISKLIPDITPGCKRIGISDDYLQALCQSNVTVNTSPIDNVQGQTITTEDGSKTHVDVLCLATGFNVNGFLGHMQVYGRNNVHLNKLWDENSAKTYKTVNIHGFPNFFMMLGPGSGLGHNSVVTMIECQIDYGIRLLDYMLRKNIQCMDPKKDAQEKFSAQLQRDFKGTTWATGCKSWYQSKQNGEIQFLWPKTVTSFYFMLNKKIEPSKDYIIN
ncbi:unnamed protein product [Mucor fragilis]